MNIGGAGNANQGLVQSLGGSSRSSATAAERVATGLRINRAQDDPAGLAILTNMIAQETGIEESMVNIQSNAGMVQVGQAAADSVTEAVQRGRALAVRAADDSLSDGDRKALNTELQGLMREINQTTGRATYNGKSLLDGSADVTVQSGANEGETSNIKIDKLTADVIYGQNPGNISIETRDAAAQFITTSDQALAKVGGENLKMGAYNNQLNRTLDFQRQNLTATSGARDAIGSADIAREMTNKTVSNILNQSNLAMVSQGNANASTVLRLFG